MKKGLTMIYICVKLLNVVVKQQKITLKQLSKNVKSCVKRKLKCPEKISLVQVCDTS